MATSSTAPLTADEQQEKLRRFVDEWRSNVWEEIERLDNTSSQGATRDLGDVNEDPLLIQINPNIKSTVLDLIAADNRPLNKLITVLAHDCLQIARLRQQVTEKVYPRLMVFGLRSNSDDVSEGELQKTFASSLPFFQELLELISKLRAVLSNLVKQLEAIFSIGVGKKGFGSFRNVRFQTVMLSLATGFAILVTIDELIAQNSAVGHALSLFTRMLQEARSEPSSFGLEAEQVEFLAHEATRIDNFLMGGLFQRFLQEDFYGHLDMQKLKQDRQCLNGIVQDLQRAFVLFLSRLDSLREYPGDRGNIVGLLAVWIWHSWMSGVTQTLDKKTMKLVLEVHRRAPVLHLFCNAKLVVLDFLSAHLPAWSVSTIVIKDSQKESNLVIGSYLAMLDDALVSDSESLGVVMANWLVSFDSTASLVVQQLAVHAMLGTRFKQLAQGVYLGNRLQHRLWAAMNLHAHLDVPISKEQLRSLRHIAEILKAVEGMFHRRSGETALGIGHMLQLAQSQIQRRLIPIKAQLEADLHAASRSSGVVMLARSLTVGGKLMDAKLIDSLAAVNLALKMVQVYSSVQSIIILRLALDVLCSLQPKLPVNLVAEMMDLCSVLELVANIQSVVKSVTDCSFLYWSRETMPACFGMLYGLKRDARHLQLVINAFKDPVQLFKLGHVDPQVIESYEKEMEDAIHRELVAPLCRDIETDLRLHVHSAHLKGAVNVNPTKTGVQDLSWFLHLRALRLPSKKIHLKTQVESYLTAAFYDHTALALHNWKTYGEMRHLAELKYRLELDDIHLPGQTLEQGVDVLEIMRNIHLFVACYTYNLNAQVFIERASNAHNRKYLNTVNARHVANSIRTHGLGIMSTTVNFVYQFLAQKFVVFSQFLFDDHIKSRLSKEHRFYKEWRSKGSKDYPVGRADNLNKDVRKLGLTDDGLSYLDQFRQLVSEMGNALGFVQMVRLGGLHYCSSASGFVHNLNGRKGFGEVVTEAGISNEGISAAKILDQSFDRQKVSTDRTDYLSILTSVFSLELRSIENFHLKDFFLIVPALTLNAVEAILQSKERMSKRGRDGASGLFTDDGFALGLAYILKVLGQDRQFGSLHWFNSARSHFSAERAKIADGLDIDSIASGMNGLQIWSQKLASISEEEARNFQLVIKRISSYLVELELIHFTFNGARIFFHQDHLRDSLSRPLRAG